METLQLRVGDTFELRLPGRGSAGYGWIFHASGALETLSVSHSTVAPAPAGPPRTGSADEVFTLQAVKPGRVELHFELRRSWEKNVPAAQERFYEIEVLPAP